MCQGSVVSTWISLQVIQASIRSWNHFLSLSGVDSMLRGTEVHRSFNASEDTRAWSGKLPCVVVDVLLYSGKSSERYF